MPDQEKKMFAGHIIYSSYVTCLSLMAVPSLQ